MNKDDWIVYIEVYLGQLKIEEDYEKEYIENYLEFESWSQEDFLEYYGYEIVENNTKNLRKEEKEKCQIRSSRQSYKR